MKMKSLIALLAVVFFLTLDALSQPVPRAATQAEVNAGTATAPYVNPKTLTGWTGGGGGSSNGFTMAQFQGSIASGSNTFTGTFIGNGGGNSNTVPFRYITANNMIAWNTNVIVFAGTNSVITNAVYGFTPFWGRQSGTYAGANLVYTNFNVLNTNVVQYDGVNFYLERVVNTLDGSYFAQAPVTMIYSNSTWTAGGDLGWTDPNMTGSFQYVFTNKTVINFITEIQQNTNIVRVETWGDDGAGAQTIHTTNSSPFSTPSVAAEWATPGDTIVIGIGYFSGHSFRTQNGVNIKGSGKGLTYLNLYGTNFIPRSGVSGQVDGNNFNANGFCIQSNTSISDLSLTNCHLILAAASGTSPNGSTVKDVDIFVGGKDLSAISGELPYSGTGICLDQPGTGSATLENVRIFTGYRGIASTSSTAGTPGQTNMTLNLVNCSVLCYPSWTSQSNLIALAFNSINGFNVNIRGGSFRSINGRTNTIDSINAITNLNLNTALWLSTNSVGWKINFSGTPEFITGTTNASTAQPYIIESASSSNVISGIVKITQSLGETWQQTNTYNYSFDSITGNGSGLTNLNAANISSGTVAAARLPIATTNTVGAIKADGTTTSIDATGVISVISTLTYKQSCTWATAAALPSSVYNNGSSGVGATITGLSLGALTVDGNSVAVNDRILVKDQVNAGTNGIYTVTISGSVGAVFILTRVTDFDQSSDIAEGDAIFIEQGSANTNTSWVLTTAGTVTVGTTPLNFAQTAGPITLTGAVTGNGIGNIVTTYSAGYHATNIANRAVHSNPSVDGNTLDSTKQYACYSTNANLTINGFSGLVSGFQNILSMTYSNSSASPITITGPPGAAYIGAVSTNSMVLASGKEAVWSFWIRLNIKTNVCNAAAQ